MVQFKCLLILCIFNNVHALLQKQVLQGQSHYLCLAVFLMVHAGKCWRKTNGINACAPVQQTKLPIISCRPIEFSSSFLLCIVCFESKDILF